MNWGFMSQKTTFFIVTAVETSDFAPDVCSILACYSSDLASSDFHLFTLLKKGFGGMCISSIEEVKKMKNDIFWDVGSCGSC
jgi:hypothetical protein